MSCLPQPRLLLPPATFCTSRFQIDQRNVFYLHILPYLGLVSSNAPMQCSRCKSRGRVCKSTIARYFIWASGHAPRATGGCGSSSLLHKLHKVLWKTHKSLSYISTLMLSERKWFIFLATHVAHSALQTMFVFAPGV